MLVSGIGESKSELYGREILGALERFKGGERAKNDWQAQASSPARETLELLQQGNTFEEIARRRGRKVSTVVALISSLVESGETEFKEQWMDPEHYRLIEEACLKLGTDLLRPIKDSAAGENQLRRSSSRRLSPAPEKQEPETGSGATESPLVTDSCV